ncbi:MAG: sulfatase-like hydrolase/transferase, partial [Pontiellaceae bacterium]|nr:sulfatase-like hydrolase/transferase [Pontiellaceae bacterium]
PVPAIESLKWTLTGDVRLSVTSFVYGGAPSGLADVQVVTDTATNTFYDLEGTTGIKPLSGASLSGAGSLTFAQPTNGTHGAALSGFTFDLFPSQPNRTNGLPNVVVILADDLGYSDISYNPYHGPEVSTPNIDALIRKGVWFSSAYVSGNICAPSRAGLLHGCYQERIGVHNETDINASTLPSDTILFPQHLAQASDGVLDYDSIMLGKWHQNRDRTATVSIDGNGDSDYVDFETDYGDANPATLKYHPIKRGFESCYGFINLGGHSYWNYEDGFYDDFYRFQSGTPIDGISDGDALETYLTTRLTDKACEYIQQKSAEHKPFFVYLAYNAVHEPMEAPSSPSGLSEGDPGWYPDAAWFNTNYPNMWQTPSYSDSEGQAQDQATRAILMAMLYHLDQGVGRVMAALEASGQLDNTIVFFLSDNGGASASRAANDPLRERKHFNYEGGVRVPMCVSWPGGLSAYTNTVVDAPVMSIDILPTVLDAADIEPVGGFDSLDGKSLLPLIRGEVSTLHDALFWSEGGETGEFAVRSGDWKLYMDENVFELYNLAGDIGETTDLSAQYPEKVRELHQKYFDWIVEMTDACGDSLEDRMWIFETPPPNIGPGNMVIEEFNYPSGSLAGSGGGSGWISAWNGTGDMRVQTNSLRFPNAHYNQGGATGRSANDETSVNWFTWTRSFAEPITDGTVWLSFLSSWDPDAIGVSPYLGPSDNGWQSLLINGSTADHLTMFGGNGNRWSGAFDDYVLVDNRGGVISNRLVNAGSVFVNEHATYLHLIKMETDVSGNNDRITWYVTGNTNGITGNTVAALESAVTAGTLKKLTAVSTDGDWWGNSLTALGIEINNTPDSQLCDISFDNIRVVYGLDDNTALAALLSGDTGIPGSLPSGYTLQASRLNGTTLEIEHDEKTGWYPSGVVYESTDSLTNTWVPVTPASRVLIDRYLDLDTYRVTFPTDQPRQFFRIRGE